MVRNVLQVATARTTLEASYYEEECEDGNYRKSQEENVGSNYGKEETIDSFVIRGQPAQ